MDFVTITGLISVIGSALAVLVVYRLVGFRAAEEPLDHGAVLAASQVVGADDLEAQVRRLEALMVRLDRKVNEKDEARWQMREESQDEVRELRAMLRQWRYEMDEWRAEVEKRLRDSDESRRYRELEVERHRERELQQSQQIPRKRPLTSVR